MKKKTLIVYYSWTGKTERVAHMLKEKLDAELFRLKTIHPYPPAQPAIDEVVKKELASGNFPELHSCPEDITSYDLVLAGGPVWYYTAPPPLLKWLETTDFGNARVAPFCTHLGGIGDYFTDFASHMKNGILLKGVDLFKPVRGKEDKLRAELDKWLIRLNEE